MNDFVRRSNLIVPITEARFSPLLTWSLGSEENAIVDGNTGEGIGEAWLRVPDAVTLDLEDGVPYGRKEEARGLVKQTVQPASRGSTEVFVRVNKPYLYADLEASVWPGLRGIVLPKTEHASDVAQASELLEEMERRRGIRVGSLELVVMLESALGVWNIREIITASPRVTQVALGERDLRCDIGIAPPQEYDPFAYARGRVVVEGTAAGVQPVGMAYPMGSVPTLASQDELLRLATMAKDLGFKGVMCAHPSWVEPVNTAFTPGPDIVEHYTQVRQVFAEAVAAGTAAVPFKGRMIDVPVDEWAKVVLSQVELCQARDEEKRQGLGSAH